VTVFLTVCVCVFFLIMCVCILFVCVLENSETAKLDSARTRLKIFDPLCSEIEKDVFLGSQTVAMNKELLLEKGITHILNCAGVICDNVRVRFGGLVIWWCLMWCAADSSSV
jgi:hypothetical protein